MITEMDVPEGQKGIWKVIHFTITEEGARNYNIQSILSGHFRPVSTGSYIRLVRKTKGDQWQTVMSNTPIEVSEHMKFINIAGKVLGGNVLINGLGVGMVIAKLLPFDKVTKITVIEKEQDVIDLVAPTFLKDPRVEIIHADALEYQPPKRIMYSAVWHDIWPTIDSDNIPDMCKLHRRYGKKCQWQGSWERKRCERLRREERKAEEERRLLQEILGGMV